jgi:phage terminase large subunit-like protein
MTSSKTPEKTLTRGNEVIAWIETHCRHTQAEWYGRKFGLMPWQKTLLRRMFAIDRATGRRQFRWAYISVPKKQGKTELMAALGLWFLIASGELSPLVVMAAGSDDQADLIFGAARIMVEESPTLRLVAECYESEIVVPSIPGARLVRVAASARKYGSTLDGKNTYVVICDELHVWEGERGEVVWGTLTRSTGARREPMVIQITTAGFDRESVCYRQYQTAKQVLADPASNPRYFAHIVEAPDGADHTDPEVWRAANPSFDITVHEEFFHDQLAVQPENEFRRYHLNQWTRSAESWLPPGAWDRCTGDATIPDGAEVAVGVDVALRYDHTAVVVAHARDDGMVVVQSKVWEPTPDMKMDIAAVKNHIRKLAHTFTVTVVSYDPRFFELAAVDLADEGINMVEQPQSVERMVPACGHAFELIVSGRLVHDDDPVLTDHVLSAVQREGERGWTLSKGRSKRKVDACIAMVLACWEASQPSELESVYNQRGLIVL